MRTLLGLALLAFVTGCSPSNKGNANDDKPEKTTAVSIVPDEVRKDYRENSVEFFTKNRGKVFRIEGIVSGITGSDKKGGLGIAIDGETSSNEINVARIKARTLATAVNCYMLDNNGSAPDGLKDLTKAQGGFKPYAAAADIVDPWDNPYKMAINDGEVKVFTNRKGLEISNKGETGKELLPSLAILVYVADPPTIAGLREGDRVIVEAALQGKVEGLPFDPPGFMPLQFDKGKIIKVEKKK